MKNKSTVTAKPQTPRFVASRQDIAEFKTHYVVSLPVREAGSARRGDYGYDTDATKAIKMSRWQISRWAAQMMFCGRTPIITKCPMCEYAEGVCGECRK